MFKVGNIGYDWIDILEFKWIIFEKRKLGFYYIDIEKEDVLYDTEGRF